jgi:O-methyltransferase
MSQAPLVDRTIADEVRRKKLSYLGPEKFGSLYGCIDQIRTNSTPGDFVEFGVALGGSGICLARALDTDRRYFGFDVFGMIPPPSSADGEDVNMRYKTITSGRSAGIDGERYYGYVEDLYQVVERNFLLFGCEADGKTVVLVKGLFQEMLPQYPDLRVALAHIDCDWYEPVLYCLNYVWPRLSPGGFIVLDDYNDWSGCKKASDEFKAAHPEAKVVRYRPHAVVQKPLSA